MASYNKLFVLDIDDISLIETALHSKIKKLSDRVIFEELTAVTVCEIEDEIKKTNDLLGKLHNQKRWYRPKGTYISG